MSPPRPLYVRRSCAARVYLYARYVRMQYLVGMRAARPLVAVLALLVLGAWGVHESYRLPPSGRGGLAFANNSQPLDLTSVSESQPPLWILARTEAPAAEPAHGAPDVAILMLACNRMQETTFALSSWSHVYGVERLPFYVSVDCSPGITLDEDAWRTQGLRLRLLSSHQRFVTEVGE